MSGCANGGWGTDDRAAENMACAGGCLCFGHAWRVFMGRCQTEIKPEIRDLKARVSVLQNSKEIEDEVDLMSDDAVSDELGKWMRDRDQR